MLFYYKLIGCAFKYSIAHKRMPKIQNFTKTEKIKFKDRSYM